MNTFLPFVHCQIDELCRIGRLPAASANAFGLLQTPHAGGAPPNVHARPVCVRGAEPAGGNRAGRQASYFTGHPVAGRTVVLDDGVSVISMSDAIMWAKLHPFSPTHSGNRFVPF